MKKNRMVIASAALAGLAAVTAGIYGQEKMDGAAAAHKIVQRDDLKWTPLIKGCELAPVAGNPDQEGAPFVLRIRCADGSVVPPHWHPQDENVTVLRGTFLIGVGDKADDAKLQALTAGGFMFMPKGMRHFAKNKGETIVQVHGVGPFKVNWVNPAEVLPPDAPTKPQS